MLFKGSAGSAILKGIAVQKVVAASAAAVVTVSAVGTAAKLSTDYIAANSQPAEPQSAVVAQELGAPAAVQPEAAPAQSVSGAEAVPADAGDAPAGHITSIREGEQVIRREYYGENNDLLEYSDLVNYDPETNSYTENIYRYDEETGREVLVRTDTYQNGQLVTSDTQNTPAATQVPGAVPSSTTKPDAAPSSTTKPDAAPSSAPQPAWQGHVTAITADGQVIRREYYDTDGRLREYSDVVNNSETGSYVENIYRYDEETNTEILVRTETGQNTPAPTAPPAAPSEPAPPPSEPAPAPSEPAPPPSEPAPAPSDPDPAPQSEPAPQGEPEE